MPGTHRTRRRNEDPTGWREFSSQSLIRKIVDLGLLAILIVAPFLMGGREPLGQVVLCVLTSLVACAWCIDQWFQEEARWRFTGVEFLLLLGIGLVALQLAPLSAEWLHRVSPQIASILPSGSINADGQMAPWSRISLAPFETRSNLIMIVCCVQFFLVLSQRLKTTNDLLRFLSALAVGAAVIAAFGLAQFFVGNGKFFWIYEHPRTSTNFVAKGPFTNANHFANFLAMAIPAQLWLIVQNVRLLQEQAPDRRWATRSGSRGDAGSWPRTFFWCGTLLVTGVAVLASMSRGGIVFMLLGSFVTLAILWRKSLLSPKLAVLGGGVAAAGMVAMLLFGDLAVRMVEQNLTELTSGNVQQLDQNGARRKIWEANLKGIQQFPWTGTGLGSHAEVYWMWFNHPHQGTEYSHAENGFLQIGLETGLIGLGLVLMLWLVLASWCCIGLWRAQSSRQAGLMAAATAGLMVSFCHSISDFVWYVPACINVVLLYATCALVVTRLSRSSQNAVDTEPCGWKLPGPVWGMGLVTCLICGTWMVSEKLPELAAAPYWNQYLRLTLAQQKAGDQNPSTQETMTKWRIENARRAAEANPRDQRIQLHAGLAELKAFSAAQQAADNNMPLTQIREAARASFETADEMNAWLNQEGVLGKSRKFLDRAAGHFRAALVASPLQPQPYLELAELIWLQGGRESQEDALVQQALRGRPFDARARFAMGTKLWERGDLDEALVHWREAFRLDADYRGHLINSLAKYVPASFFLENFNPQLESLTQLRTAYKESEDQDGYAQILQALARESVSEALKIKGLKAEPMWLQAHECFAELGLRNEAYRSAHEALKVNPSSYQAHLKLGLWLNENQKPREAAKHLIWCYRRRPDIAWLHTLAEKALIEGERQAAIRLVDGPGEETQ